MSWWQRSRWLWVLAAFCLALFVCAAVATQMLRNREVDKISDVQKLARTLEIIRTSTPADHKVLRVLFYGQSITRSGWHNAVVEHWHQAYPNTVFVVENRALGGFPSQALLRTTEQDIGAFYPDLIIFHVYGDHRAYEKIIRLFRSRTTADILVQTDHGDVMPEVRCEEGLHLTLTAPPGCKGFLWYRQHGWSDEMSYHKIPAFAAKYGLAVEPQRDWWREYLLSTGTRPQDLLMDEIHPNEKGRELMANFFNRYFDGLVSKWAGETEKDVQALAITSSERDSGHLAIHFDGSRLELIADKPLAAWPQFTVDGQSPEELDGCYQVSRSTFLSNVKEWPAVRRIILKHDHTPQEWTATLSNISADEKSFTFSVEASKSGAQGNGRSDQVFLSKSGTLEIEPEDWVVERAYERNHIPLPSTYSVKWTVDDVCGGEPQIIDLGNGAKQYRYVVASGMTDAAHTVVVQGAAEDLKGAEEFVAYAPRIREVEKVGGW